MTFRPSPLPPSPSKPRASSSSSHASSLDLPKPTSTSTSRSATPQPAPQQRIPPPDSKGKQKEWSGPTDSLMNRMSGPSDQKAGLSRDPEEVKRIIYEASKGSKFFLDQQRRDQELTVKVNAMLARLEQRVAERGGDLSAEEAQVEGMLDALERERNVQETIVVVDADAFYASCHELENPALKGTAFGVGGGVLTTASYEARKYGCRSAMAGFVAKKLCPHLKFVTMDFKLYSDCSKKIFDILAQYGPISPASLDEAYCSVTAYQRREGCTPSEVGRRMRAQVLAETGLTVSAGVSPNRKLSKIAADFNKPNGQYVIDPTREAMMDFIHPLPIRKIPGVGRVTERYLQALGVETVRDVWRLRGRLMLVQSEVGLDFLLRAYLGLGGTEIAEPGQRNQKGIGVERTFRETTDVTFFQQKLRTIAESLADDMASSEYAGRTITLKVKWASYALISRSKTLGPSIFYNDLSTIWREARGLFETALMDERKRLKGAQPKLRLIGLRMSNLRDEKEGKQGGRLDGFVKTTKPKAESRIKEEVKQELGDITIDDDDDGEDEAQLALPLRSQEQDILDLADSPPSSPPVTTAVKVEQGYDYTSALRKSLVNTAAFDPAPPPPLQAKESLGQSSATVVRARKREEEEAAAAASAARALTSVDGGDPPAAPSSDALWESFGDAMLDAPAYTYADQIEREAFEKSGKLAAMQSVRENSGWGATTQIKRTLEREAIEQREAEREASDWEGRGGGGGGSRSPSPRKKVEQREAVECPVCGKSFVGSEVALNAHVEKHFAKEDEEEPSRKKVKQSAGQTKVAPQSVQGRSQSRDKVKPKAGTSAGTGGKSTLDGFWKK